MINLFNVFEPQSSLKFLPLWSTSIIILLILPSKFWFIPNYLNYFFQNLLIQIHLELGRLLVKLKSPGHTHILITLFIIILMNNFFGLFPYIFTASAHFVFTVTLALNLWLGFITYVLFTNRGYILSHLTPLGTPILLIPAIILIELVSNFIRPITLAVRLAANLVAGHLLIVLISTPAVRATWPIITLILRSLLALLILELAVALIQSYVFSVLICLYIAEINLP